MDLNWLLEEFDGIIYVSDLETYKLHYINRAGCELFHTTVEEVLQTDKKCYEFLQGRDTPCPFCTNHLISEEKFYEWEYYNPLLDKNLLLKDRRFIWQNRPCRIEFATDISAYRDKITQKEKERDSVLNCLPGGITRTDARDKRTILWYGAQFLQMLGYTKEQFENELHGENGYIHPDDYDKVVKIMDGLDENGKTVMSEMRVVTRSGEILTLMASFSYEAGNASADKIPSIYSIGIDITEIREQQEQQRKALTDAYDASQSANRAKTDFLSRMSHDIRTPMNAILGMTALAEANLGNQEKTADCLRKIESSGKYLLALINEVLDMSKIESGCMTLSQKAFSLSDLVQSLVNLLMPQMKKKNQNLTIQIAKDFREQVIGDGERLQQILVNLLSNAVKYTTDGGNIRLTLKDKPLRVPNARLYEFVFEDDGIGMSEEFMEHIFEPFARAEDSRTSKVQGTGLGMAISRNFVQMMNGNIKVESKLGKGSRFTVTVPLKLQEDEVVPNRELEGKRVLIVSQDAEATENLVEMLSGFAMKSVTVKNREEAISETINAHNAHEDYFASVSDWKLFDSSDESIFEIKARLKNFCPPIIVTAYDSSVIADFFDKNLFVTFLAEPIFRSKLLQVMTNLNRSYEKKNEPDKSSDLTGAQILLAEDNELNREIAQELLEMQGARVTAVENGAEAVNAFIASPEGFYDTILMDIQMPVMNGYEATERIRSLQRADSPSVPIIALTANAFSEDVRMAKEAGFNEHLTKPFDTEKMFAIIAKYISKPESAKETDRG